MSGSSERRGGGEGQQQRAERVLARCRELARLTDVPGETTRLFLSPATREAHALLRSWMEEAGLSVRTDAIGNLRGLLPGPNADSPQLLIGSHIDTVPNAGAFDGPLGVLIGLALVDELRETQTVLPFAVELIAFSEEEGVRFGKPFLGSLALIGELDSEALARTDGEGVSIREAIRLFGLNPDEMDSAIADPKSAAYLEFHIEQGPVLESEDRALAVVDAIAGQTRATLTFTGHANHAGTTPMGSLRRDALASAAEWIGEVERYGGTVSGLVATVGKVDVPAGASNVVPGVAVATLDVRHTSDSVRKDAVEHQFGFAQRCAEKRGVQVSWSVGLDQSAVPMDRELTAQLVEAVSATTGESARVIPSGAGHDAMIVARRIPSAMLFLRSPGGLSHHPEESVLAGDVEAALDAGLSFLRRLRLL